MKSTGQQEQTRRQTGRPRGSKNKRRKLPTSIHPEQRLTIADMVELSGKSRSFFHNNLSLSRKGKPCASLPKIHQVGRNIVCRAADFFEWLNRREVK